jgi:hypothetical protein
MFFGVEAAEAVVAECQVPWTINPICGFEHPGVQWYEVFDRGA